MAIAHGRARQSEGYGVVRIWNAKTGEIVGMIAEPKGGGVSGSIEFAPDGSALLRSYGRVASVPGDSFVVHQMGSWQNNWSIRTNPFEPHALAVSPDGKFAALGGVVIQEGGMFGHIEIVDLQARAIAREINAIWRGIDIVQIAWSADGTHIAAGARLDEAHAGQPAIRIFDVKNGKQIAEQTVGSCEIRGLAFTADRKYMLQGGRRTDVELWDSTHSVLLQRIPISADALSVSRDGRRFAVAAQSNVSIWNLR